MGKIFAYLHIKSADGCVQLHSWAPETTLIYKLLEAAQIISCTLTLLPYEDIKIWQVNVWKKYLYWGSGSFHLN